MALRLGIRAKQIAGVTAIVGLSVVALSALYVTRVSGVVLRESHARGQLLASAIFHRARQVVTERVQGKSATHLVFFDRHGWYCEHGRACPAVDDVRKSQG